MQLATRFAAHLSGRLANASSNARNAQMHAIVIEIISLTYLRARARSAKFVIEFVNSRINNRAMMSRAKSRVVARPKIDNENFATSR